MVFSLINHNNCWDFKGGSTLRSISAHVPRVFINRYIQFHIHAITTITDTPCGGEGRVTERRRDSNPQPRRVLRGAAGASALTTRPLDPLSFIKLRLKWCRYAFPSLFGTAWDDYNFRNYFRIAEITQASPEIDIILNYTFDTLKLSVLCRRGLFCADIAALFLR